MYEYAARFAIRPKPPSMDWIRRNARITELERRERRDKIDLLQARVKQLTGPAYFDTRMYLRGEILKLHGVWR